MAKLRMSILLVFLLGFAVPSQLFAQQSSSSLYNTLENEYDFVRVPADIGRDVTGGAFQAAGVPMSVVVATLYFPFSGESSYQRVIRRSYNNFSDLSKTKLSYIGYYSIGIPLYLVKKAAFDMPVYCFEQIAGGDSPAGQSDGN